MVFPPQLSRRSKCETQRDGFYIVRPSQFGP